MTERVGSVYESLLELHPTINRDTRDFKLDAVTGSERKTTGSYYTPTSLISSLLDTALDPVLDEAAHKPNGEEAILRLAVVDPACGSGHFLIAAANRIAKRLAAIRSDDPEPSPGETRAALRDVVGRCIHGVDVNPMAVELCKISLWMEALEPGRPLSFLDHRIVLGNSLLGATPELMSAGIPADAYKPIPGDDKHVAATWRLRNAREQSGQLSFDLAGDRVEADARAIAAQATTLALVDDRSLAGVRDQQQRFQDLLDSPERRRAQLAADTWCAAFVAVKDRGSTPITQDTLRRALSSGDLSSDELAVIAAARSSYAFLHWHVAFPVVWERGGFDVVLGNPPWERVQFEERAFFSTLVPKISAEANKSRRTAMIAALSDNQPAVYLLWEKARRRVDGEAHFLRASGRYPLAAVDKFNLYAVFVELAAMVTAGRRPVGLIVKGGFLTDKLCAALFAQLMRQERIVSAYEFENRLRLFRQVDSRERFVLVTLGAPTGRTDFCFDLTDPVQIAEPMRHITMDASDLALLSPNQGTCPKFASARDLSVTRIMYQHAGPLIPRGAATGTWDLTVDRYINVSDFSKNIVLASDRSDIGSAPDGLVPIAEGKLIAQFDHRYASYPPLAGDGSVADEVRDKGPQSSIRYLRYIPDEIASRRNPVLHDVPALVVARDITNRTNERGVIAALVPPTATDYTLRVFRFTEFAADRALVLTAVLNSFALDFCARQKLGGTHLSNYIIEELPILPEGGFGAWWGFVVDRAFELSYTSTDLASLADALGRVWGPFRWDPDRRAMICAELDATMFHLYGIGRDEVDYILGTFPIVRRHEEGRFGEYRTKRQILERYDALVEADASGVTYETPLDPPPGDPRAAQRIPDATTVSS